MSQNQLAQESSPYLLLHKDNPVHWRAWGPEALAEAESSGKPILLSIGYTACHWCHVMNEESFADAETAALMNELYVNIKVDREERPDIDQIYQAATNVMGGQGGWPLTIFLTPGAEPFFSGTYFPPAERQGQPAFKTVLSDIHRLYREQPEQVANATNTVSQNLQQLWGRNLRGPLDVAPIDQAAIRVGQRYDLFFGGMQGTPKFPNFAHVEQLFRAFLRGGVGEFLLLVQSTLGNICQGGIYDHLGGGIHRYSTDERWLVPHFEKMLYDNAMLVDMLTLSWKLDRNTLYRQRIEETIGWVLRDMMVEQGFASSVDADSEGEEGKYYLWSEAEIDAALAGTFSQKFKQVYNVQHDGNNVLGRNILHRLGMQSAYMQNEADEALFTKQRSLLLEARNKRIAPLRDNKVLTDWNGMMIAALANAGMAFGRQDWINAAIAAFAFVEKISSDGDRLFHSWSNGTRGKLAFSDDYAHMIRAALMLWQATGERRYFERAQTWTLVMNTFYWDSQNGGYFGTADDADALIVRPRSVFDMAAPCANGIMPALLGKLFQATWDPAYRDRANAVLDAFSGEIGRAYISMPSFMNSLESVMTGLQVLIVGPKDSNKTRELVSAVTGRALPYGLVMIVDPSERFPEGHPAFGKTMEGGNPTAYICQQMTCSAPITNPVALSQALQLPRRQPVQQQQQMGQPAGRA